MMLIESEGLFGGLWVTAYVEAKLCGQCFYVLSQCEECDDESVSS